MNLETRWIEDDGPNVKDLVEVRDRIGKVNSNCEFLSGGLANHNYDLGDERVLRIYKRSGDPSSLELERKLNDIFWSNFETPTTIECGEDFLIQRKLNFIELLDQPEHGRIAGRTLGEIHNTETSVIEGHNRFLTNLFSTQSLSALISEKISWSISTKEYLESDYRKWLTDSILVLVDEQSESINSAVDDLVLLHGDCKPSNIKKSLTQDSAVVFDWEFSFVGPRLVDIGHFLRWGVSSRFLKAFTDSYKSATNVDLSGKYKIAKLIDLVNISFQLAGSEKGSSRESDILDYLERFTQSEMNVNKPLLRTRRKLLAEE